MPEASETTDPPLWAYAAVVVVAVLLGAVLAPQAAALTSGLVGGPSDAVAVVHVDGPITASSAEHVREDLRDVRGNESIEAVVLRIDSPGGTVSATESLYMAVNETAREMPVVASVASMSASGGYFGMMPAEPIFVQPSSMVGSVGVVASTPSGGTIGSQITTGPDKGSGYTEDEVLAQVETLRREFVNTVMHHRGEKLDLSREQLSYAKVYLGARAVQNGVADEIGGRDAAIAEAASQADLTDYRVVEKEPPRTGGILLLDSGADGHNATVTVREEQFGFTGVDTTRFLALYGQVDGQEVTIRGGA